MCESFLIYSLPRHDPNTNESVPSFVGYIERFFFGLENCGRQGPVWSDPVISEKMQPLKSYDGLFTCFCFLPSSALNHSVLFCSHNYFLIPPYTTSAAARVLTRLRHERRSQHEILADGKRTSFISRFALRAAGTDHSNGPHSCRWSLYPPDWIGP